MSAAKPAPRALDPIGRRNLGTLAYEKLRKALTTGELRPGERLNGRDLAMRLGTSLTPVREALLQLTAEGALEMQAGRYFTVPMLTRAAYLELRELRMAMEGMGAERAAERITQSGLNRLAQVHEKLMQAKAKEDFTAALRWNEEFHLLLAGAAGMPRLLKLVEGLWSQSGPFLNYLFDSAGATVPDPHPHVLVLKALRERDGVAAATAIRRDILEGGAKLLPHLAEQPDEAQGAVGRSRP
ncbi:GntR family transcriptional regulator [Sabulicella rubraurantiaca]|uniref:GntR family transcriptional regulator n=1 Tax=Sabulicella rubraurantiaca TaxID=2811429 RepID=UPI001A95D379|nr:GntR family transcriptional regulator [Sabulicella rubraurantiaca]